MKKYEWAVVGSGIAGISTAEILTRQGHSCILIEKNDKLASETTRGFHEWLHTGSLFTLIPDRLATLKYILGAIDDLLEYYGSYSGMNLIPTESGLVVEKKRGRWFNDNYIHFKFRINRRKIAFPWLYGVARALFYIEKIHEHDWLRRRAGEIEPLNQGRFKRIFCLMMKLLRSNEKFAEIKTPDMTINSRCLLRDMMATALHNGLELSLSNEITKIKSDGAYHKLIGKTGEIHAENIALCNGRSIKEFHDIGIKESFAPIAVVSGLSNEPKSFVELDCFPKNCINQITKGNGIAQVGGISFSEIDKCDAYLDYVVSEHKKYEPNIKEIHRYNGIKSEIVFKKQPRGYLYNIVNISKSVWVLVPGKFTLAFSMAPEFYRRIYKKNPVKSFSAIRARDGSKYDVSETTWNDAVNHKEGLKWE